MVCGPYAPQAIQRMLDIHIHLRVRVCERMCIRYYNAPNAFEFVVNICSVFVFQSHHPINEWRPYTLGPPGGKQTPKLTMHVVSLLPNTQLPFGACGNILFCP